MSLDVKSLPEYRELLQKVIAAPEDNAPRKELADWLASHDDPKRAEFIRVQLMLAETPACPAKRKGFGTPGACCVRCDLETRLFDLLVDHGRRFAVNGNPELSLKIQDDLSSVSIGQITSWFERGFVSKIEIKCEPFLANALELFSHHPITKVILKDRPPAELPGGSGKVFFFSDAANVNESNRSPIPHRLFSRLAAGLQLSDHSIQFESYQEALDSLSRACVKYANELVDGSLIA